MSDPVMFGSVCSGIEAASVAWNPLGWRAAWLAEIEANPSTILKHHYPDVPNLGDMNLIPQLLRNGDIPAPDVFCGGTPCQAFSLAGLRNSLDDARGNLSLKFCEIANEIDIQRAANGLLPCIVKWENVPGVLSTKDNAFGHFLAGLCGEDDPLVPPGKKWADAGCVYGPQRTVAWRVLDAQYFGLAQRRRRVFVVASAREGFDPVAVLFEREGVRRDSPPSRGAREETAGTLAARTDGSGFPGTDEACSGYVQPVATAYGGNNQGGPIDVATARNACTSASGRLDYESFTFEVQPALSVALRGREGGGTAELGDDLATCLRASTGGGDKPHVLAPFAHAFDARQSDVIQYGDFTGPLDTCGFTIGIQQAMAVRRLTPRECERLQGFPDNYTLVPLPDRRTSGRDGDRRTEPRMMADGPRYKALGNSWAVPVVRWIGKRIDAHLRALDKV